MKKKLLVAALAVLTAAVGAAATAKRAFANPTPCTTVDGRNGYLISTGRDQVCQPTDPQ